MLLIRMKVHWVWRWPQSKHFWKTKRTKKNQFVFRWRFWPLGFGNEYASKLPSGCSLVFSSISVAGMDCCDSDALVFDFGRWYSLYWLQKRTIQNTCAFRKHTLFRILPKNTHVDVVYLRMLANSTLKDKKVWQNSPWQSIRFSNSDFY